MNTKKLTEWAIAKIISEYKDDVCLLLSVQCASFLNDSHGECFDYYIPATERGNQLAQTFIIDGIGYDLYPRSWSRIENMAELKDGFTAGLGNAEILYYRTEEDKNRFVAMQNKLFENLNNKEFMYQKALEKLDIAMEIYRTMMFEDALYKVRVGAGYIADYLSVAVACMNGTYFKNIVHSQITELSDMKILPDNFIEYYKAIINADSGDELRKLSHLIIKSTRKFISVNKPERTEQGKNTEYTYLADWYQELSLTWRRIYINCDLNNVQNVFADSVNLQNELNIIKDDFGLQEMDLLGSYHPQELFKFRNRAAELEAYILSVLEKHGIKLRQYNTVEEFLSENR